MMTREDAKRDAEKIWRTEETDVTRYTEEPPSWSGASKFETPAEDNDRFVPVTVPRPEPDHSEEVQAYIADAQVRRQISEIGKDNDPVNHPSHYSNAGGHEPIKVIEAWDLGFHLGNTVKYISRAGKKDPNKRIEDLKKAAWYLARHIENLENDR